jgi:thiamine-phosphate pyrophosphorylase
MPPKFPLPIIYPITSGQTTPQTTPDDPQFFAIFQLVRAAVDAEVPLFQIREKSLPDGVLHELTSRAVEITRGSKTRLIVNGRADVARAAGADGAQLNVTAFLALLDERVDPDFVVGVSVHSFVEAEVAAAFGADFAVFGPVFETESKRVYGPPQGLGKLREVAGEVEIPVLAIGGITLDNVADCFKARASGVAAISLLNNPDAMPKIVADIRRKFIGRL